MKRIGESLPKSWAGWLVVVLLAGVIAVAVAAGRATDLRSTRVLNRHMCQVNLETITAACQVYAADNGGNFPDKLGRLSPKYLNKPAMLKCPGDKSQAASSYAIVPGLSSKMKSNRILLYDRAGGHMYVARTNGDVDGIRGSTKEDVEAEIRAEAARERRD